MAKSVDFMRLEDVYGAHNYKPIPVVIEKGEGVWVWDVEGKRYLYAFCVLCTESWTQKSQDHFSSS